MTKNKDKYLLVVSFLEGKCFSKRPRTKLVIEAKFDGEQLATDPVEHDELIEINQELAWELDKKALKQHRLQRSAIKAIFYAVNETTNMRENIGYIVLDIQSAPEGAGKPKTYTLLNCKYPKLKPQVQVNIYVESDADTETNQTPMFANNASIMSDASDSTKKLTCSLVESEGYFLIGKANMPMSKTYVLTITIAFARNLVRLLASDGTSPRSFFFTYTFLDNQVTTKPFEDIISCQINGERSSIRLHATFDQLKRFFSQQNELTIAFCSEDRILAKTYLSWKNLVSKWNEDKLTNLGTAIVVDYLLKFESIDQSTVRASPTIDVAMSPVIGVQIGLVSEQNNESLLSIVDNKLGITNKSISPNLLYQQQQIAQYDHLDAVSVPQPSISNQKSQPQLTELPPSSTIQVSSSHTNIKTESNSMSNGVIPNHLTAHINQAPIDHLAYVTEEMQLKVAYELQLWKEAREQEFEQHLKKLEAKKFQALAEAFKQHDIERELLVQKRIKEYNDLELVLKNSLNEVEKREKQLALNEAQIARLKADMHHELENKLIEYREASKRVQEKADHQVSLQKVKIDSLEEDICRLKRQILDAEKKYADKEAEFSRYKERESSRPEMRLQSEINMLQLEKVELERKLESMTKAKNHYKDQWTRALQEIGLIKKREESNAKMLLKKQQNELEQLRMKYLAAEETESLKTDERQLKSIKHELEKMKLNSHRSHSECSDMRSSSSTMSASQLTDMDPSLKEHIQRLTEERDTLLRTGVYSNTDAIIIELDKRIRDCLKEAKLQQQQIHDRFQINSVF